jgi:DNA-binding transcriptional LysR family regulator
MTSTQQWPALIEGRIDVGFTRSIEPEFRAELHSEVIQQDPMIAILPKNHPAARGPIYSRDSAHEPFVLSSRETSPAVFDKVIESSVPMPAFPLESQASRPSG